MAQRTFQTLIMATFATGALLLAALGTYSTLAYSVSLRSNEIGIRVALGAERRELLLMVLRQGFKPVVFGLGVGIGAALALGRFLSSLLFSVRPTDVITLALVSTITLSAAFLACWIPAWRATRVDPMAALRCE